MVVLWDQRREGEREGERGQANEGRPVEDVVLPAVDALRLSRAFGAAVVGPGRTVPMRVLLLLLRRRRRMQVSSGLLTTGGDAPARIQARYVVPDGGSCHGCREEGEGVVRCTGMVMMMMVIILLDLLLLQSRPW